MLLLERFPITLEQEYPNDTKELNILKKIFEYSNVEYDEIYAKKLIQFANLTRKTYKNEGCTEIISTRRLVQIIQAYSIFEDQLLALDMCISRFDEETKGEFIRLYKALSEEKKKKKIVDLDDKDTNINAIFKKSKKL